MRNRHAFAAALAALVSAELVDDNGVQWGVTRAYAESKAKDCLASLRATAWHAQTEKALKNHPFVKAAERGRLPFQALQRFVGEQRFIQANDAASFAQLAGSDWRPTAAGLLDLWRNTPPDNLKGLFGTLLKGELAAAPLLQRLIHATGLDYDAHGRSEDGTFFAPEPRAQAYGAYWALLAPVWKSGAAPARWRIELRNRTHWSISTQAGAGRQARGRRRRRRREFSGLGRRVPARAPRAAEGR